MRNEFSRKIARVGSADQRIVFLTGDLGFKALENVQTALKDRFINVGVSEQNMISMAASLASEGLIPICYSIAPFTVFRPAEQIRLDVCLHDMNVKIVGNGGGYGYGIMGATHHAIEDLAVLSSFQNMTCYVPFCSEEIDLVVDEMIKRPGPAYLRLGSGKKPDKLNLSTYKPIRQVRSGNKLAIVALGPILNNVLTALGKLQKADLAETYVVSEMPLKTLPDDFLLKIQTTGKLLVVEEHVKRGGLAEHLAAQLLERGVKCTMKHVCAQGYPNKLYGSQAYHQKISGLDPAALGTIIRQLVNEA